MRILNPSHREIRADVLYKLARKGKWGASHTDMVNLHKSCPSHLKGEYKDALEELVKEGFLLTKTASYGHHVSLNPRRREEILAIIKEFKCIV